MSKGKKLVNKLRNAHRFVQMRKEDSGHSQELLDEWEAVQNQFIAAMDEFKWGDAIHLLTNFFWHRFCDYWIEYGKQQSITSSLNTVILQIIDWYEIFFPDLSATILK